MQDNFDKLKLELQASETGITSILTEIETGLESLGKEIETLKVSIETTDEKVGALEKQEQELNSELTQLKQEHQNLDQDVEQKEKQLKSIQEQLEDLQHQKNSLESEIVNKKKTLTELQNSVNNLESEISEIKQKLLNAEELKEEKVGTIEREVQEYQNKIEMKTNQYKVLQNFLETGYEQEPKYDVVKVLKQPGISSIDKLVLSSGVARATVEDTLNDLEKRGVVSIQDGKFSIEKDISIGD